MIAEIGLFALILARMLADLPARPPRAISGASRPTWRGMISPVQA